MGKNINKLKITDRNGLCINDRNGSSEYYSIKHVSKYFKISVRVKIKKCDYYWRGGSSK